MIERLLERSVRHRAIVLVLTLVLVVLGLVAARRVAIDAVPDVTDVQVQIITAAPALGPVDVETNVTFPVELAMAGLPGVQEIRSITRPGISVVTVVFDESMDVLAARRLVAERLPRAKESIPGGYGDPQLGPMSSGLGEIFHFEVKSVPADPKDPAAPSLMDLRSLLDWQIAPRLRLVPGVVEVNTFGGEARSLEVALDPERLAAAHVGVAEVVAAIERNHLAVGGGHLRDGREHVTVRGEGRVRTAEELGAVVIERRGDTTPLLLRELGDVRPAPILRYGAVTRDARGEAVVGVAMMLLGANSGETAERLREAVGDIQKSLPPGVVIDVYYDRTELVHRTLHTVTKNLLEAVALVVLVLLALLSSLRAGTVVAVAIPLALLGVFGGMWALGVPGNLLSLGAIDFGLVVDGAIIIVENAMRRLALERRTLGRDLEPAERDQIVVEAAKEVRGATAFGEAIIALVYVPLLALEGVEGRMFRPMALTVLFALGAAFVLSLTVVPALASLLLSRRTDDRHGVVVRAAERVFAPLLRAATRWPAVPVALAAAAVVASVVGAARMGQAFLPKLDEGTVVVTMVRLPSISLEQSLEQTRQVEEALQGFPEVKTVVCRTGRAEIAIDPMGMNMTDVYVLLEPRERWTTATDREGLVKAMDEKLVAAVPGVGFAFTQPIEMNTNDLLAGISSDLAVHVYGSDLGELNAVAERAVRLLRDVRGAHDVRAEQIAGSSVLDVRVDRLAAARRGLDVEAVLRAVEAVGGIEVGTVVDGAQRYPIRVRFAEAARRSPEAVAALPIRAPDGAIVPLGQVASVAVVPGPAQVSRERLQRRVTVQLNVRGRDIASFVEEAKPLVEAKLAAPPGYSTAWAGEYERLAHARARFAVIIPITLALILVLLVSTFGRLRPALLVLLNVPAAVTGGIGALAARGMDLSISAAVGFIALSGVAVLNGLVLVSTIEHLRGSLEEEDAVREGTLGRLRPVLTTALVASLGFLPMMLATGAGAEVQRPVATVVVGGIVTSTLQTLLVLPALYRLLTGRRRASAGDEQGGEPAEQGGDEASG